IIVFCTGFGIVISQLGERARIVVDFFVILDAVIMRWVETLMWYVNRSIKPIQCPRDELVQVRSTWYNVLGLR
ncbi:hypothetical protein ANCDUO_25348, partial [Ancylostoma duodenale]